MSIVECATYAPDLLLAIRDCIFAAGGAIAGIILYKAIKHKKE